MKSILMRLLRCRFYWGLDCTFPALGMHNMFLASDFRGSFDEIFARHRLPAEPSFYIHCPARIDPSAAPKGLGLAARGAACGLCLVVCVCVCVLRLSEEHAGRARLADGAGPVRVPVGQDGRSGVGGGGGACAQGSACQAEV